VSDWIGLDIGGANLKWATSGGLFGSVRFPMWKKPHELSSQISECLTILSTQNEVETSLAITMTGELADCFESRKSGVAAIVEAVMKAAGTRTVRFYGTTGQFHDADWAIQNWLIVAASNWHATATLSGKLLKSGDGFLIDIGSTTTDLIPIKAGVPVSMGRTDFDRLRNHELLYLGVRRTPVCSLCDAFMISEQRVAAASEFFATVEDAFVLKNLIAESPSNFDTADGRPATRQYAAGRLARMVCNDANNIGEKSLLTMADQIHQKLVDQIDSTLQELMQQNPDLPAQFVITGQGEWLAQEVIRKRFGTSNSFVSWNKNFSPAISESAAAYSVLQLARSGERDSDFNLKVTKPSTESLSVNCPLQLRVIKLGGSLLDSSDTPQRIERWLSQQMPAKNCWIVGGGGLVDHIRRCNKMFSMNEIDSHWICVDLMSINARLVQQWFPNWPIVRSTNQMAGLIQPVNLIFDTADWLRDEDNLPTDWSITSDSIAAHVATILHADELVLLKSCPISNSADLESLAEQGIVDTAFPSLAKSISSKLVNLREI